MTDHENQASTAGGLSAVDRSVRALIEKWAADKHVVTVNRSYGAQTTGPVSVDALEALVKAAMEAERARWETAAHAARPGRCS